MTRLRGSRELERRLAQIPDEIIAELRPALVKGAQEIADAAEGLVPEAEGDLLTSITVTGPGETTPPYASGGGSVTLARTQAAVTVGSPDVRHGHLQEFGTAHHEAQPFLRPAFRLEAPEGAGPHQARDREGHQENGWRVMHEPSLTLQTAFRAHLLTMPELAGLVMPQDIRSGSTKPGDAPASIIFGHVATAFLGHASGGQRLDRVALTLHVWAPEDAADTAQQIGGIVTRAWATMPRAQATFDLDERDHLAWTFLRDATGELAWSHGVSELDAVVRAPTWA